MELLGSYGYTNTSSLPLRQNYEVIFYLKLDSESPKVWKHIMAPNLWSIDKCRTLNIRTRGDDFWLLVWQYSKCGLILTVLLVKATWICLVRSFEHALYSHIWCNQRGSPSVDPWTVALSVLILRIEAPLSPCRVFWDMLSFSNSTPLTCTSIQARWEQKEVEGLKVIDTRVWLSGSSVWKKRSSFIVCSLLRWQWKLSPATSAR
jgi:hypothetical protein